MNKSFVFVMEALTKIFLLLWFVCAALLVYETHTHPLSFLHVENAGSWDIIQVGGANYTVAEINAVSRNYLLNYSNFFLFGGLVFAGWRFWLAYPTLKRWVISLQENR